MNYEIKFEPFPIAKCFLNKGETLICQNGAMAYMSPNIKMETTTNGGLGKAFGRLFSGENMFQNRYTAMADGFIALGSHAPGKIVAFDVRPGRDVIVQKSGFLACEPNVELSVFFQKKFGSGFFGGEGFIMQKLSGNGTAFLEFDGYIDEFDLLSGEKVILDTGYLAAMDGSCSVDIQSVAGVKNALFGGEGLYNTVITGPGHVWVQTSPIKCLADALRPYFPSSNS